MTETSCWKYIYYIEVEDTLKQIQPQVLYFICTRNAMILHAEMTETSCWNRNIIKIYIILKCTVYSSKADSASSFILHMPTGIILQALCGL